MSTETLFTVFCDEVGSLPGYWPGRDGQSLRDVIDVCGGDHKFQVLVPTAWAPGVVDFHCWEDIRAASIAAGRTIELVDGKYVPRGVAVEDKPEPTLVEIYEQYEPDAEMLALAQQAVDAIGNRAMVARDSTPRKPLLGQRPAWFDPFPGFTVTSSTQDQPKPSEGWDGITRDVPATSTAKPAIAGLQRFADFDGLVMKVR